MQLTDFPEAIANSALSLLEAQQVVRKLQFLISQQTARIDQICAFDKTLTNDAQRKAKRTELMESGDIVFQVEMLDAAKDQVTQVEIEHQLLLNQFAVAKLEKREGIAKLETMVNADR